MSTYRACGVYAGTEYVGPTYPLVESYLPCCADPRFILHVVVDSAVVTFDCKTLPCLGTP